MKNGLRGAFRVVTIVLLLVAIWTAYANVFSDDTDLRAQAGTMARQQAGCGDKCKVVGMHGSRGMLEESIDYEIDGKGAFVVTCRRAYVIAGEYACDARKR
ncbi:MAG: hypothetical protein JWP87_2834 [Labilithrix sp.]|nr:hypothetical protein [Labilithrix sp.]